MGKGIVMLRDFGSLTRVVWAGDRMVLAQDRGGKHCIVDPEMPRGEGAGGNSWMFSRFCCVFEWIFVTCEYACERILIVNAPGWRAS